MNISLTMQADVHQQEEYNLRSKLSNAFKAMDRPVTALLKLTSLVLTLLPVPGIGASKAVIQTSASIDRGRTCWWLLGAAQDVQEGQTRGILPLPRGFLDFRDYIAINFSRLAVVVLPLMIFKDLHTIIAQNSHGYAQFAAMAAKIGQKTLPSLKFFTPAFQITQFILFTPLYTAFRLANFIAASFVFLKIAAMTVGAHLDGASEETKTQLKALLLEQAIVTGVAALEATIAILALSTLAQPYVAISLSLVALTIGISYHIYNQYYDRQSPEELLQTKMKESNLEFDGFNPFIGRGQWSVFEKEEVGDEVAHIEELRGAILQQLVREPAPLEATG